MEFYFLDANGIYIEFACARLLAEFQLKLPLECL